MYPDNQANIEWWFRVLYDLVYGTNISGAGVGAWLANLWSYIIWVGYALALVALVGVVYFTIQLFELRRHEEEEFGTLNLAEDSGEINPRWTHIESLVASTNPSDWRQAIIEADIMLGDMLTRQGYRGASLGEQLQQVEPSDFDTLQQAWEAHKVRNDIAHQGLAFNISSTLAQRTIAQYQNVFREFGAI
jgi:hypothetical protein